MNTLIVRDAEGLNRYTSFDVLLPGYNPEGYRFDRAELYKDKRGEARDSKYINIYDKHSSTGKEIFMQQRAADEETAYHVATSAKIEPLKINADAVLSGEHTLDWEAGGVLHSLTARDVSREELIKIAESIRMIPKYRSVQQKSPCPMSASTWAGSRSFRSSVSYRRAARSNCGTRPSFAARPSSPATAA